MPIDALSLLCAPLLVLVVVELFGVEYYMLAIAKFWYYGASAH